MKYKAYLKQKGEGCDYTIGCARTVIDLKANSMEEATTKLEEILTESYIDYYHKTSMIESAEIFEVNSVINFDIEAFDTKQKEIARQAAIAKKEAKERAEFERLRQKFG